MSAPPIVVRCYGGPFDGHEVMLHPRDDPPPWEWSFLLRHPTSAELSLVEPHLAPLAPNRLVAVYRLSHWNNHDGVPLYLYHGTEWR